MNTNTTDEQLLRAFVKGDRASLGELADRYETSLLGLAGGLLGTRTRACDAVQEAWLRVIRHSASFNGSSSFKTWMYRITINCCRDLHRKRVPRNSSDEQRQNPKTQTPPEDDLIHRERNSELHRAIIALDRTKRETILLCYHDSMNHQQAAEVLNIPLGTLKSRLNAALNELRRAMRVEATK